MAPKVNKKATKKAAAAATTVVAPVSAEEKASNRYLPKKEAEVFRTILTEYENKKHKNGLVLAEQILSQYPHHGGKPRLSRRGGAFLSEDLLSARRRGLLTMS